MNLPRRMFSLPAQPAIRRKSFGNVSPEGVLIYPGKDLQGDELNPEGGRYEVFERNGRTANFEHGPHVGTGRIEMKAIEVGGEWVNVPFATTTFFKSIADARNVPLPKYDARGSVIGRYSADECLAHAEQVAPLVLDGSLNGLSVEFRPVSYQSLGPHPMLEHRDACRFDDFHVLHYAAACHQPVNNNARYVLGDADLPRAEKAFKLVFESTDTLDLIRKSFRPLAEAFRDSRKVVVPVKTNRIVKADPLAEDMTAPVDPPPDQLDDGTAEDAPASVAASQDAAQVFLDCAANMGDGAAMALDKLKTSDNPAARKKVKAAIEAAMSELQSLAEKHGGKLQSLSDQLAAKLGSDDDSPIDEADDAPDPDTDESGMVQSKAFPAYIPTPRRLKKGDIRPPVPKKAKPVEDEAAKLARIEDLERQLGLA